LQSSVENSAEKPQRNRLEIDHGLLFVMAHGHGQAQLR
jgi:hypothetical protein